MTAPDGHKHRSFTYGSHAVLVVVAVLGLVAAANYLGGHHQIEIDFTRDKVHEFSSQTVQVLQQLDADLIAEFYGDVAGKDRYQALFENYQRLSPRFKLEFVDVMKDGARARAAGVKKINTLILTYKDHPIKLDELNEAKITRAIVKIKQEKKPRVCFLVGHGEPSIEDVTQGGLQSLKQALEDQAYEVKELVLSKQEISADCTLISMVGTEGALFAPEMKSLADYFKRGGAAVLAWGGALKRSEEISEALRSLMKEWGILVRDGLIVDPDTRKMGVDPSMILVNLYNPHQPITQALLQPTYLPFARPIEFSPRVPAGFSTESLAKTNEGAWAETQTESFIKGNAERDSTEVPGSLSVAVATRARPKDTQNAKETRIVVFGSSQFVNNQYSRLGANLDLYLNAVGWTLDDETLISVRPKDEEAGRVEMTEAQGIRVFWLIVVIIPTALALIAILVWRRRKRL